MTRPPPFESELPSLDQTTPTWTKEGPLNVDDGVWVRVCAAILLIRATFEKPVFSHKKGYFCCKSWNFMCHRWKLPVDIWRVALKQVCKAADYQKILTAICERLDKIYPQFAPWTVLEKDAERHSQRKGITIQIFGDEGRQPTHFDNGIVWMEDAQNHKWCSTAIVVHLCDSYGTFLAGPPVAHVFSKVGQYVKEKKYVVAANLINELLRLKDETFKQPPLRRAGHMLSFHPGEQAHAGVGSGTYRCSLTQLQRATLYCTGVPQRFFPMIKNMSWAGAEGNTFGLVDSVNANRVFDFRNFDEIFFFFFFFTALPL
jgi:hypothetical protein